MKNKSVKETRQLTLDIFYDPTQNQSFETGRFAIDQDFPEDFADTLSQLEAYNKHLFRPNTYLHKWWARRCGSTFRAILKQFVPEPGRRDYYMPKGLEGKTVLDPMMGGGTTLHEAIRLGANVIGADIDPIPVIQARASLTDLSLKELQSAFDVFAEKLAADVGKYFQTECPTCNQSLDSLYTLYGLRKRCACREVVQIEQYDLRHESNSVIRIWPDTWVISDTKTKPKAKQKKVRLVTRDDKVCDLCGEKYQEYLDLPYYKRYTPIAIAGTCLEHGFFFRVPGKKDLQRIKQANELRGALDFDNSFFVIANGPKSGDLKKRKINSYLELFSSRQLLFLYRSIKLLQNQKGAVRDNLALLVSTSLEFNSLLCGYKGYAKNRPGAIKHVFAHHAYSIPYTAAENNPVNARKSSGNLKSLFQDRIERGRKWAISPVERRIDQNGKIQLLPIYGEHDSGKEVFSQSDLNNGNQNFWLLHSDSRHLPVKNNSVDFVITDPPYYDSVQYSDLAAFFRVWLAFLLPDETTWVYDESRSAVAKQGNGKDTQYLDVLSGIFKECNRVLKSDSGRMVFTFHHWDPNAWADLTIALKSSGFYLINSYVTFSENPISIHIQNLNAIKHDAILVLWKDKIAENHPVWEQVQQIETVDSETFCRQCGATLGWLLESDISPEEIRETWKMLIRRRNT